MHALQAGNRCESSSEGEGQGEGEELKVENPYGSCDPSATASACPLHAASIDNDPASVPPPPPQTCPRNPLCSPAVYAGAENAEGKLMFAPFGYGPRNCLGMNLALLELRTVIPELVRRFEFRLPEELQDREEEYFMETFLTLRPRDKLPLLVTKRQQRQPGAAAGSEAAAQM